MRCYSCRKYDNCELPWKCSSTMYDCSAYELEQTNEEWLKSMNTEQLAMWIAEEKLCRGYFIFPSMEEAIQDALKWLKEKHQ